MSETLERAYRLLLESREKKGLETYGETLDTSKVDIREYLFEEMADALMYAARIIRDLESDNEQLRKNMQLMEVSL